MKKVLVIGSSGLVGSRFIELAKDKFDIIPVDRQQIDITDKESIKNFFSGGGFEVVVNLAAYTDVAGAEKETGDQNGITWKLNVLAPRYLAEASKEYKKFFIHFSTDFVFEGLEDSKGPFDEDTILPNDNKNLCWYGWTKNRGEVEVSNVGTPHAIVRIANPFRSEFSGKTDFIRKILDLYDQKNLFPLFTDQIITPIFVDDITDPLTKIIDDSLEGNFHIVSADTGSYFEVGSYALEKARGVKDVAQKASLLEFLKTPERNKRPVWGGLATKKTQEKLNMKFKAWREMIDEFALQLKS